MVNIRPHIREDIEYRIKWLNNKKATIFVLDNPDKIATLDSEKKWFDDYEDNENKKFFSIEYDGQPVGFMGLSNIDMNKKNAIIFILIGEDKFRGKGIGKKSIEYMINYAFKEVGLESLSLEVSIKNNIAIKLYLRFGFKKIGESESEIKMILKKI